MAEELSGPNSTSRESLEITICQPDHPNQAIFIGNLDISLSEFRSMLADSDLVLPEAWLFMTRARSVMSTRQEEDVLLTTITSTREDTGVLEVMIAPALPRPPLRAAPNPGASPLASFATIIAALRDVYVTTIQPNMHDLIKPMILIAGVAAVLSFILALVLSLSVATLGGLNHSVLVPFLRSHLCGEEIETASQMPKLYKRIHELENKLYHMRKVEVGTMVCDDGNYDNYEDEHSYVEYVPFRKTNFSDEPRIVFSLLGGSVDHFSRVRVGVERVNSTGFEVKCSYSGSWRHYSVDFSWIAVGK